MNQAEEYVKRILKVLIFIEENIDEELTMEEVAKVACYSPFHFHRIFQTVLGETVHQYIRRLRMQRAAEKLRYTAQPVTEIALDTSYDTPSAFTKAFKQFMGNSPKRYRALYAAVNTMSQKIQEFPMIKPDKIEKNLPDLNLLFVRKYGNYTQSPLEAWHAIMSFVNENHLDRSKTRYFGIAHDDPLVTSEDKLRYDAAILVSEEPKQKDKIGRQILKGGKYATFTHQGSYYGLERHLRNFFLKWLPDSRASFDETRSIFCEYFNIECIQKEPEELITKLYIPLV